jgi:isopentenyl-diphosphate delta-isomerase
MARSARKAPKGSNGGAARAADNSADHVILVDERDQAVGTMAKLEAHQKGERHRAISVIVRDARGRLLLHERAAGKYHSGGLWTNTCCSHPRPGEETFDAAARRLSEEMGIVCPLGYLFSTHYKAAVSNGLIEHEIVHVFGGRFDGTPKPDPSEIAAWEWRTPADIARDIDARPDAYSVWFRKFCREFWSELNSPPSTG